MRRQDRTVRRTRGALHRQQDRVVPHALQFVVPDNGSVVLHQTEHFSVVTGVDIPTLDLQCDRAAAVQSVIDQALQALDRQWVTEVFEPCQKTIAPFYPFQASDTDVAIGDVASFFSPDQGKLWAFVNQQLHPFIQEGEAEWTLKSWRGLSLPLSTGTLESLRYAKFFSSSLFLKGQGTPSVPFELYPYSDQGPSASLVSHIRFNVGDQEFIYDMGPTEWEEFLWPGPSWSAGSFLQVKINGMWESREEQGWWGLFRLLEDAQITPMSETLNRVIWAWDSTDSRPLRIQYDLRARRAQNPFHANFFSKFSCLAHLAEAT